MTLVLPGDAIPLPAAGSSSSSGSGSGLGAITLGPGIRAGTSRSVDPLDFDAETADAGVGAGAGSDAGPSGVVSSRMGVLNSAAAKVKGKGRERERGEKVWVEGSSKRYIAAQKESVLGTIIARHAEGYRVDIGTSQMASLDALAFEGATKRSKPNLKIGTLVYARVSVASRDMETELECVDATTGKAEGFGELKGGLVIPTSLEFARRLLTPKHPLLPLLAAHFPYELAIGMNGRVWLKAADVAQTVALKRVLEGVEEGEIGLSKEEVGRAVRAFMA